jgi:hypothetical protein
MSSEGSAPRTQEDACLIAKTPPELVDQLSIGLSGLLPNSAQEPS